MQGVVLIGVAALCSCAACPFLRRSRLDKSTDKVVGLMLGALVGFLLGSLLGLLLRSLVGILGTGGCGCLERVILLLSLIWVVGMLGGACTLGTHCMLRVASGVVVFLNLVRCACK
jgi:hypothetical protein